MRKQRQIDELRKRIADIQNVERNLDSLRRELQELYDPGVRVSKRYRVFFGQLVPDGYAVDGLLDAKDPRDVHPSQRSRRLSGVTHMPGS